MSIQEVIKVWSVKVFDGLHDFYVIIEYYIPSLKCSFNNEGEILEADESRYKSDTFPPRLLKIVPLTEELREQITHAIDLQTRLTKQKASILETLHTI
jgi:hypothetical protein